MNTTPVSPTTYRLIWWTGAICCVLAYAFLPDYTPWGLWLDIPLLIIGSLAWVAFYVLRWRPYSDN